MTISMKDTADDTDEWRYNGSERMFMVMVMEMGMHCTALEFVLA